MKMVPRCLADRHLAEGQLVDCYFADTASWLAVERVTRPSALSLAPTEVSVVRQV